jgi:hypothetical protein
MGYDCRKTGGGEDLAVGYTGTFLDDSLEKKYQSAAKDFIWQWFFPQETLTTLAQEKEIRRYHLQEKDVQAACTRQSEKQGSRSESPHTSSAIRTPRTCFRPATTSARSRRCSATPMSGPR